MTLDDLEAKLLLAQERMRQVEAGPYSENNEKEYWAASYALLEIEREVAAARGEAYAAPLDFPVTWDTGAPSPHLIKNDYRTYLAFLVNEVDPHWDGIYIKAKNPNAKFVQTLALVTFQGCSSAKLGSPNDEVFEGHPLAGKGMDGYSAQIIENSPWIAEVEAINKVHTQYNPERWRNRKHYIFWFHDSTFECIADSFTVELYQESIYQMLMRMVNRLAE
jgi:hypothetical protein